MLRGTGTIGINIPEWQRAVNNIETKNDAISQRLNPNLTGQSYFAALTEILAHLEEVNGLVDRYKEAVIADIIRLREVGERMRRRDREAQGIFVAI